MRFCQKPEKKWAPTCASDYEYTVGYGSSYHTVNGRTFEQCATDCDSDPRCNAYGDSHRFKQCQRYRSDVPTVGNQYYDVKVCIKPMAKRPKDCASNYDYIYGRVPVGGFKRYTRTATMMNTNDCAKLCD